MAGTAMTSIVMRDGSSGSRTSFRGKRGVGFGEGCGEIEREREEEAARVADMVVQALELMRMMRVPVNASRWMVGE